MAAYQRGDAAYQRGDYATAIRELRPLAEQGNANAQFRLGVVYRKGRGVPQDYAEAMGWWRKAAEQGYATAQYYLGVTYHTGLSLSVRVLMTGQAQLPVLFESSGSTETTGTSNSASNHPMDQLWTNSAARSQ